MITNVKNAINISTKNKILFIEDLDEHDKREKEAHNKIVENQYNDKIAQIKREFLLRSVFQP